MILEKIPMPVWLDLIRRGAIRVYPTNKIKMLDNRICCPWARRNDPTGPQTCGYFAEPAEGQPHCRLGDGRPCAFHEPRDSEVWRRIDEQNALQAKYYPERTDDNDRPNQNHPQ